MVILIFMGWQNVAFFLVMLYFLTGMTPVIVTTGR